MVTLNAPEQQSAVVHTVTIAFVHTVTIAFVDLFSSMIGESVDLGGWRKWRFRGSWMGWVFAFNRYAELFEPGSDCGLAL